MTIGKKFAIPEVDLITLNRRSLLFQHQVLKQGHLIYEAEPRYRVLFTQRVIQAYLDFQPTLELIDRFHTAGMLRRCGIR